MIGAISENPVMTMKPGMDEGEEAGEHGEQAGEPDVGDDAGASTSPPA